MNDIKVQPELQPLYDYLAGRGSFVHLDNYRPEFLPIFSRDVLRRIAANDDSWESMVPAEVAELIKRRGFLRLRQAGQGLTGPGAPDLPTPRLTSPRSATAAWSECVDPAAQAACRPGQDAGVTHGAGEQRASLVGGDQVEGQVVRVAAAQ